MVSQQAQWVIGLPHPGHILPCSVEYTMPCSLSLFALMIPARTFERPERNRGPTSLYCVPDGSSESFLFPSL